MKYDVTVTSENDPVGVCAAIGVTKRQAIKTARASKRAGVQVFIDTFRVRDGQHMYLNPNGDHDIIGKSW
jgi:hypothetical protein